MEIEGIAEVLGVPTKRALVLSFIYEYMSFCTSIVARQENGTMVHMRIMDSIAPEILKKVTYVGEFY
jgi:penicillin V acylase-like amidase (Ntn superfamily)